MADRETAVYYAKLAEQIEDYDEMLKNIKDVAEMKVELSADERKLFRTAYSMHITKRRVAWERMSRKEESERNEDNAALINGYKRKIETEITNICTQVLTIIHECIIPSTKTHAGLVFFHTMRGDYYKYQADIKTGADRLEDAGLALQAYTLAKDMADSHLAFSHPARLGLALSLAVFHHEIERNTDSAYKVGQQAIIDGFRGLHNLNDEEKKDTDHLLKCLDAKMIEWSQLLNRKYGFVWICKSERLRLDLLPV